MNTLKNSVQLIGRLGKNVELSDLKNGRKMGKFSLATSESYKNKNGEKVEDTQWHNIVVFGNMAEIMSKFLVKGNQILVKGKLSYSNFQDKDGNTRYFTSVVAQNFFKITKSETVPF